MQWMPFWKANTNLNGLGVLLLQHAVGGPGGTRVPFFCNLFCQPTPAPRPECVVALPVAASPPFDCVKLETEEDKFCCWASHFVAATGTPSLRHDDSISSMFLWQTGSPGRPTIMKSLRVCHPGDSMLEHHPLQCIRHRCKDLLCRPQTKWQVRVRECFTCPLNS